MEREITEIFVHCAATRPDWMADRSLAEKVAEIDRWHKANGWRGIGYHWIVDRDGARSPGRPETQTGAHVRGHNEHSIGVCLVGGHGSDAGDDPYEHFTGVQMDALADLLRELLARYPGARIRGHNEVAAKACPGFYVPKWWAGLEPPAPEPEEPRGLLAMLAAWFGRLIERSYPK